MGIGLLISGQLGFEVMQKLINHVRINFVFTDGNSTDIITFCNKKNMPYYAGNPRHEGVLNQLPNLKCEVIISVNYLFIIKKNIIELPEKIAINFHGSLLPKYRGRTPHVWAIINNEIKTGITAHMIDEGCDTGDIIAQRIIPISTTDTGGSILEKFKKEYPHFVLEVLKSIESNTFVTTPQNNALATFFGKRSFEDGQINWNWQRERIYNWVRAQAIPYPGAFTYHNGNKIIINKIQFSEFGFHCHIPNGSILDFNNKTPIVKTPNGCIELVEFKCDHALKVNNILR